MLKKNGQAGGLGIVFLHGFGANAADLFPLVGELSWSNRESWYFPDAPLEVPIGPHMMGRAWFPISVRDLENAVDYSGVTPPGMERAANQLYSQLQTLPHEKLIIGGFSQGAMLATQIFLQHPERFLGLAILSGALVHEGVWKKLALKTGPRDFFQSHGQMDPVLPVAGAERLHQLLTDCDWQGSLHAFRGGHEIPMGVLRDLRSYLQSKA